MGRQVRGDERDRAWRGVHDQCPLPERSQRRGRDQPRPEGRYPGQPKRPLCRPAGCRRPVRSESDLRKLFAAVGAFERDRVICYCGGGISATMDALALTRLGHPSVAVYDGSMSEWAADPAAPMAPVAFNGDLS
ncbi:MAG: rhodanese-like domain-containing protein [Pseudomonadota bacterium]